MVKEEDARKKRDPRAESESMPPEPQQAKAVDPKRATTVDTRIDEVEPLVATGDWKKVAEKLGPRDKATELPPTLGLAYAVAIGETAGTEGSSGANEIAIRCMASLLAVGANSPLALVLAKRIMRKNPVSWRRAPAPKASTSAWIVVLVLVLGGAVGWFLSKGSWRFWRELF